MKPTRIRMCHSLVMNYGLYKRMEIFVSERGSVLFSLLLPWCSSSDGSGVVFSQRAKPATKREMTQFHSDDYIEFLSKITPSNMGNFVKEQHKCQFVVPRWFHSSV
jgi:histone deacetylase 1/2